MQRMDQLTILKLGGSAITDKGRECTPDIPAIQRIADQLRDYNLPLILIHGGGSNAHPPVTQPEISRGLLGRSQLGSIPQAECYFSQLRGLISSSRRSANKLPVPFL